jgi:DNA-directed RNA polymerase
MLRDPIGGAAVNLVPQEKPADVYQQVADLVLEQVKEDANSSDEKVATIAKGWLAFGVTRKVCKRPVMTLAYGAKAYGFKDQVFHDSIAPSKFTLKENFPWADGGWPAADYMGTLIWQCVGRVVLAAREAMDWLQVAARMAAKEGLPVRWTTPDGLPVLQAYPKLLTRRIDLTFNGGRIQLTVATDTKDELDDNRQINAIAPNWVHSMDASHLRATVRKLWDAGMRSFSLIHDSYGTHCSNLDVLAETLREAFVEMYTDNEVLDTFARELQEQLPDGAHLPPPPRKGDLDLSLVMDSEFFFA